MNTYHFTEEQLTKLLEATIGMYEEYQAVHGYLKDAAKFAAEREMVEGLDAEKELVELGECKPTLQIVIGTDPIYPTIQAIAVLQGSR